METTIEDTTERGPQRWRRRLSAGGLMVLASCSDPVTIIDSGAPLPGDRALPERPSTDASSALVPEGAGGTGPDAAAVEVAGGAGGVPPAASASGAGGGLGGASGGPGAPQSSTVAPPLFSAVELEDAALAREALALLGSSAVGASGSCSACHVLGRPTLTRWQQLTAEVDSACSTDTPLPDAAAAAQTLACLEGRAGGGALGPAELGIYAAAVHLPWFTFVFEHGAGGGWRERHLELVARAGMPRSGEPWTQAQFDLVADWFARGLPGLFGLVPEDSGEGCTPWLDTRLAAHVEAMQTTGWAARNREVPLLMFGCAPGESGAGCALGVPGVAQEPAASWGAAPGTTLHVLWENTGSPTSYWSRSSADGRFFASGLAQRSEAGYFGQIVDLQSRSVIAANFDYDPTFFPDNSGFMLQRGRSSPGFPGDVAVTCEQSVLLGGTEELTGLEPECSSVSGEIGLYQQLARSLDGEDYWVAHGPFTDDDGFFEPVLDNPQAPFASDSATTFVPMVNQGNGYETGSPLPVATPLQGDPMLSPSGRLLVTRAKGAEELVTLNGAEVVVARQSGYVLHLVELTRKGARWSASLEELGRLCTSGGKAVISFDERWMLVHRYVTAEDAAELGFAGADDPGFAPYLERGASDLHLIDLRTGERRRITRMPPGQYALFPHFRSDGWIYFVVRSTDGEEWLAASDAALVAASTAQK